MSIREADLDFNEIVEKKIHNDRAKRMFDIALAFFGIIVLMPLMIAIAVVIKMEDPKGGILFRQTRVGKNGETFRMFKFRSMVVDADQRLDGLLHLNQIQGAMFKIKQDPRITRVGKLLRRTSLDELPQLFNVLKGNMSIVGPRPPLPREVEFYTSYDFQRLRVIPGCTGLWQVSGRSAVNFKEMVELDLKYIRQRSFWFDLKLIFRTISVIIRTKDAY